MGASGTSRSRACGLSLECVAALAAPPRSCRRAGWRRGRAAGCPRSPSSSALKLDLSSRSASGERASISRHQATVSRSRSASGTTALTSPISSASSASYWRQRNQNSFARLVADGSRSRRAPKPPSKRADPRAGLPESGVVGGDRHVAADVEDMAAADRVARHHRDHRLGQPPDLHVQVARRRGGRALSATSPSPM